MGCVKGHDVYKFLGWRLNDLQECGARAGAKRADSYDACPLCFGNGTILFLRGLLLSMDSKTRILAMWAEWDIDILRKDVTHGTNDISTLQ